MRFSLGLRGYRMDQVDQVLDRLAAELAAKDAQIEELRAQLANPASDQPAGETEEDRSGPETAEEQQ